MLRIMLERLHQGHRTLNYPRVKPQLPPLFRGRPRIRAGNCGVCNICTMVCPTGALTLGEHGPILDMGLCLFCDACRTICPRQNIVFTKEHRMAALCREELLIAPQEPDIFSAPPAQPVVRQKARELFPELAKMYKHSLRLRQVSAGGCNACEADCNVLTTLTFDLSRFGIDFVASPRHADGLAVTGPVSENMRLALLDTYAALPDPRVVLAVGACAISGGMFRHEEAFTEETCAEHARAACAHAGAGTDTLASESHNGVTGVLSPEAVHVYIPGCPPNPWTILDGMLLLLGREETG